MFKIIQKCHFKPPTFSPELFGLSLGRLLEGGGGRRRGGVRVWLREDDGRVRPPHHLLQLRRRRGGCLLGAQRQQGLGGLEQRRGRLSGSISRACCCARCCWVMEGLPD